MPIDPCSSRSFWSFWSFWQPANPFKTDIPSNTRQKPSSPFVVASWLMLWLQNVLQHVDYCTFGSGRMDTGPYGCIKYTVCISKLVGANYFFQINIFTCRSCYYQHASKGGLCCFKYQHFRSSFQFSFIFLVAAVQDRSLTFVTLAHIFSSPFKRSSTNL